MSEVNGPKISVNQVNYNNLQKQTADVPAEQTEQCEPKITDFGNPKAEALGRSMLIKGGDNINNDLKALIENPQIADNSDKMFETAYNAANNAGIKNPYEAAADFSTASV